MYQYRNLRTPTSATSYETVAHLPDPSTVKVGTFASVVNDPIASLNRIYLAVGAVGTMAIAWV
jgi:hypothetical protein